MCDNLYFVNKDQCEFMHESVHEKTFKGYEMILTKTTVNDNRLNGKCNKNVNNYDDEIVALTNFNESKKRFSNNMDYSLTTSSSYETLGCSSNTQNTPSKGKASSYSAINNPASIRNKASTTKLKKVTKVMNKVAKNKE